MITIVVVGIALIALIRSSLPSLILTPPPVLKRSLKPAVSPAHGSRDRESPTKIDFVHFETKKLHIAYDNLGLRSKLPDLTDYVPDPTRWMPDP